MGNHKNINNEKIKQYFMDETYKIVPYVGDFKSIIPLLRYIKSI